MEINKNFKEILNNIESEIKIKDGLDGFSSEWQLFHLQIELCKVRILEHYLSEIAKKNTTGIVGEP